MVTTLSQEVAIETGCTATITDFSSQEGDTLAFVNAGSTRSIVSFTADIYTEAYSLALQTRHADSLYNQYASYVVRNPGGGDAFVFMDVDYDRVLETGIIIKGAGDDWNFL